MVLIIQKRRTHNLLRIKVNFEILHCKILSKYNLIRLIVNSFKLRFFKPEMAKRDAGSRTGFIQLATFVLQILLQQNRWNSPIVEENRKNKQQKKDCHSWQGQRCLCFTDFPSSCREVRLMQSAEVRFTSKFLS